jgi:hypothetical protein
MLTKLQITKGGGHWVREMGFGKSRVFNLIIAV